MRNITKTKIDQLEEQLEKEPVFIKRSKSISVDLLANLLDGEIREEKIEKLSELSLVEEVKNDTYFSLKSRLNDEKINLTSLEKEIPKLKNKQQRKNLKKIFR